MLSDVVKEITSNTKTPAEKAEAIFYFVRDEIKFDVYLDFPDVEEILMRRAGACYHKAMVMVEMMRVAGIPARFHFVWIRKEGLKDILHPLVYKFWPEKFIHTYPEIKLNGEWIMFDAAYDREFHNKLIKKDLNFGKDEDKISLNIDFSLEGVKSVQDLYIIVDAGYDNDLTKLKKHLKNLPFMKKLFMGLAGLLSRRQIKKIRNEVEK